MPRSPYWLFSPAAVAAFVAHAERGGIRPELAERAARQVRFVAGMRAADAQRLWHQPIVVGARRSGAIGVTVGRYVYLKHSDALTSWSLLVHETVHVAQYLELGTVGFLVDYSAEYVGNRLKRMGGHKAYLRLGAEVQARKIEKLARRASAPEAPFTVRATLA